jgi:hypothetical protein
MTGPTPRTVGEDPANMRRLQKNSLGNVAEGYDFHRPLKRPQEQALRRDGRFFEGIERKI